MTPDKDRIHHILKELFVDSSVPLPDEQDKQFLWALDAATNVINAPQNFRISENEREKARDLLKIKRFAVEGFLHLVVHSDATRDGILTCLAGTLSININNIIETPSPEYRLLTFDERVVVADAFSTEMVNKDALIKSFVPVVYECICAWDQGKLAAPYFAIVQSSGIGKSRLVVEAGEFIYVTYICLRPETSDGFPPRSSSASLFLRNWKTQDEAISEIQKILLACLLVLYDKVFNENFLPEDWRTFQQIGSGGTDFHKNIENIMYANRSLKMDEVLMKFDRLPDKYKSSFENGLFPFLKKSIVHLFVFDEGSEFVNWVVRDTPLFEFVRRVLKRFSTRNYPHFKTCAVFLDTCPSIVGFSPAARLDPSRRLRYEPNELFRPYWEINAWFRPWEGGDGNVAETFTWDDRLQKMAIGELPDDFFQIGRLYWSSIIKAKTKFDVPIDLVSIGIAKMLTGLNIHNMRSAKDLTFSARIAILDCLTNLFIQPCSHVSSTLVSSHMALCLEVHPSRETLYSSYGSEPVLVEACYRILFHFDQNLALKTVLDEIPNIIRTGIVDGGRRGEYLMRLTTMLAWANACVSRENNVLFFNSPIPLRSFLISFIGEESESWSKIHEQVDFELDLAEQMHRLSMNAKGTNDLNNVLMPVYLYEELLDGIVFATHWVYVKSKNSLNKQPENIRKLFATGAAIQCPNCYDGVDGIVPIYLPKRNQFTFLLLQSRNKADSDEIRPQYHESKVHWTR